MSIPSTPQPRTVSLDAVRSGYAHNMYQRVYGAAGIQKVEQWWAIRDQAYADFDLLIATVKADALREAADALDNLTTPVLTHPAFGSSVLWIHKRAATIETAPALDSVPAAEVAEVAEVAEYLAPVVELPMHLVPIYEQPQYAGLAYELPHAS